MEYSYKNIIKVGGHIGDLKRNYNIQMGFYALGFRNSVYIFDINKIFMNIINVLLILKKIILYKCKILVFNNKPKIDNINFLKNIFYNLNIDWFFGNFIGGSISNKNFSLWKNKRKVLFYEDYSYTFDLSVDSYLIINNYNYNNIIYELLNDFSILISINDSNFKVEGLTYILPFNVKNIQSIYFILKIFENFLKKEIFYNNNVLLFQKNLNLYSLYLKRIIKLRKKLFKNRLFIQTFKKFIIKKSFGFQNLMIKPLYLNYKSFLKRSRKKKWNTFLKFNKIYIRNNFKCYKNNVILNKWFLLFYVNNVRLKNFPKISNKFLYKYLKFNKNLFEIFSFKFFSYLKKNKLIYNKIIDYSKYMNFFDRNLYKKNIIRNSIFFKKPIYKYYFFFNKNLSKNNFFFKNLMYVYKNNFNFKDILTVYKFIRKHKKFGIYVLPKNWTFYMKYNVFSKRIMKLRHRWFLNFKRKSVYQKRIERLKHKKHAENFDKKFNKRFKKIKRYNKKFLSKSNIKYKI